MYGAYAAGFTTVLFSIIAFQIVSVVVGPCVLLIFLIGIAYFCYKANCCLIQQKCGRRRRDEEGGDGRHPGRSRSVSRQSTRRTLETTLDDDDQSGVPPQLARSPLYHHSSLERVSSKRDVVRTRSLPTVCVFA